MTSVALLPDENDYPLFESIIHYIDVNGPTKVSRLRDRLKADSKDVVAMCEFAAGCGGFCRFRKVV
ncbi:MAG: hypothetical protein WDA05_05160 [Candidatus Methanomethylophilaceae archaeon]